MKPLLFLSLLLGTGVLHAQSFRALPSAELITGLRHASTDFADVDGDGDLDMIAVGSKHRSNRAPNPYATLYFNHNNEFYKDLTAHYGSTITPVTEGSAVFGDVDNDGDLDLVVTGNTTAGNGLPVAQAEVYLNDGTGTFTTGSTLSGVWHSDLALGDLNGDGYLDLLMLGTTGFDTPTTLLYLNDGMGGFSAATPTALPNVGRGALDLADIEGDGDLDLVIAGATNLTTLNATAAIYTNDGSAAFALLPGASLIGMRDCDVRFADLYGNGNDDLLLMGTASNGNNGSNLYTGTGTGTFAMIGGGPANTSSHVHFEIVDLDSDGDNDLLSTGSDGAEVLLNNGSGVFSPAPNAALPKVEDGTLRVADLDGDGDLDVSIFGDHNNFGGYQHFFYLNDGNAVLTEQVQTHFLATQETPINVVDMDGDGHLDIFVSVGSSAYLNYIRPSLYTNGGSGPFLRVPDFATNLEQANRSAAFVADVDGDGDQDAIITGIPTGSGTETRLYFNDGNNGFTSVIGTTFPTLSPGVGVFADVDGDGDQDFFLSGISLNSSTPLCHLYYNNGSGGFTLANATQAPFPSLEMTAIEPFDVDGDGDLDCILGGIDFTNPATAGTFLFKNDGTGSFTQDPSMTFNNIVAFEAAHTDVDADGDGDLFITGAIITPMGPTMTADLFLNNGSGAFTAANGPFVGTTLGGAAFGDVDGDNDPDLIVTGSTTFPNLTPSSSLYLNNGGTFTSVPSPFDTVYNSSVVIVDLDGDSDNDVLIAGYNGNTNRLLRGSSFTYYENTIFMVSAQAIPNTTAPESSIFPNPNSTGLLHLNYDAPRAADVQVQLLDLAGRVLDRTTLSLQKGPNTLDIDIQRLPAGAYLVHLTDGEHTTAHQLLVP